MDVLEYVGEKGGKQLAEWSGKSVNFSITMCIRVLGELSEGGRTPVKMVTECSTRSTAPKEGFGTPLTVEELVPSPPEDERARSVVLSPFFVTTTSEPRSS